MNETFINEVWKDINSYEGKYQVSNYGRIKSFPKFIKRKTGSYFTKEKVLKCTIDNYGYPCVNLYSNGTIYHIRVHILVAKAFIENPNGYSDINHIDGNKQNNSVDNLEWCTRSQNTSHAFKTGLRNYNGCKNPHSKLTQSDVETIRRIYVRGKHCENNSYGLAKRYNVSPKTIQNVVNGNHY